MAAETLAAIVSLLGQDQTIVNRNSLEQANHACDSNQQSAPRQPFVTNLRRLVPAEKISNARNSSGRLQELDALRGIAALVVLTYHYAVGYPLIVNGQTFGSHSIFQYGRLGVHLFFIISGFVILMTLERSKSPSHFAISRAARLVPAYFFCAAVTLSLMKLANFNPQHIGGRDIIANATMMPELFHAGFIDPSYWTLANEITFYFSAAFCFYTFRLRSYELVCLIWLLISAVSESQHFVHLPFRLEVALNLHYSFLFVAGMMLYLVNKGRWSWLTVLTLVAAGLQGFVVEPPEVATICLLFIAAVWLASTSRAQILNGSMLVYLGGISYSLYLVHQYVGYWVIKELVAEGLGFVYAASVATVVVVGLASIVRYNVELPAQRRIRNLFNAISR